MLVAKIIYILLSMCARPLEYGEAAEYANIYQSVASQWGLKWQVVLAVALYENNQCNPEAVSETNDIGLMQIHTKGGIQAENYKNPLWNVIRGCEKLWSTRRKKCKGNKKCLERWFQKYNPGSEGYGERVYWMLKRVEKKGREFDEKVEVLLGLIKAIREMDE